MSGAMLRVDDVEAFVHLRRHLAEKFRRVLKIGIENENALATAEFQPGAQRDLVAVVAREIDTEDVGIGRGEGRNGLAGAVLRTVIDENDLVIVAGAGAAGGRDARGETPQYRRSR